MALRSFPADITYSALKQLARRFMCSLVRVGTSDPVGESSSPTLVPTKAVVEYERGR
jgi:hypothetical protein